MPSDDATISTHAQHRVTTRCNISGCTSGNITKLEHNTTHISLPEIHWSVVVHSSYFFCYRLY